MILAEVLKDTEAATKFCKLNRIKPRLIIVVWEEKFEEELRASASAIRKKTYRPGSGV